MTTFLAIFLIVLVAIAAAWVVFFLVGLLFTRSLREAVTGASLLTVTVAGLAAALLLAGWAIAAIASAVLP